jgi:hypothetical protein
MRPRFSSTIWRIIWPDIKAGVRQFWRVGIETAVVGIIVWKVLERHGSQDAPLDSTIERVVICAIAGLLWPLLHVLWSLLSVPWRLYCEQHQKLSELTGDITRIKELASRPIMLPVANPLEKERLEIERLKLVESDKLGNREWNRLTSIRDAFQKYADEAPSSTRDRPDIGNGWVRGAWEMLERTMRYPEATNFLRFVQKANNTGVVPSNVVEAKAVLMAIASGLTIEKLKP